MIWWIPWDLCHAPLLSAFIVGIRWTHLLSTEKTSGLFLNDSITDYVPYNSPMHRAPEMLRVMFLISSTKSLFSLVIQFFHLCHWTFFTTTTLLDPTREQLRTILCRDDENKQSEHRWKKGMVFSAARHYPRIRNLRC